MIENALAPQWYKTFVENVLVPNWALFTASVTLLEFLIGLSFLLGYLVRPACLIGFLLSLNMMWVSNPDTADYYRILIATFLTLGWLGAGRCLGFDYFFYKRRRGIWW